MKDYPRMTGLDEGLVIGAGAAPWPFLDRNAEMMPNLFVKVIYLQLYIERNTLGWSGKCQGTIELLFV